jgi:hypothetical protein
VGIVTVERPLNAAARRTLDSTYDSLRSGAPRTVRMNERVFAALRSLADSDGLAVARDYAAKLDGAALIHEGLLLKAKSTRPDRARRSGAPRGGVGAEELRRMQSQFIATLRARNISIT